VRRAAIVGELIQRRIQLAQRRLQKVEQPLSGFGGDTLRVVRLRSRTPSVFSSVMTVWLRAERDTPMAVGRLAKAALGGNRAERFELIEGRSSHW
jgi:hypothetical protein